MKKEYIILSVLFVVVVVVVVVAVVLDNSNSNSNSNDSSENKKLMPVPVPPTPGPKPTPGPVGPPVPGPKPTPGPTPGPVGPLVKMNDPRFDFSNFNLQQNEFFCYYSDKFQYGSASNCGLIDFSYEVILIEAKQLLETTEWKVIIAIRQYKEGQFSGVQYFESKPVPSDVSCLIKDSFEEKYYKLCKTTVDECVTKADKAKVGYEGTTCPEEFYVDVEYVLIKKLGDMDSRGCVPKNFKIKKSKEGEVIFSNNNEDSDGKEYTTEKIKIKK